MASDVMAGVGANRTGPRSTRAAAYRGHADAAVAGTSGRTPGRLGLYLIVRRYTASWRGLWTMWHFHRYRSWQRFIPLQSLIRWKSGFVMSIVDELRKRYARSREWKVLFDELATYTNRRTELPLEAAQRATGLDREALRPLLKDLGDLGVGTFRLGRHQRPTRLIWHFSPRSVGEVAKGQSSELESYTIGSDADPNAVEKLAAGGGKPSSAILGPIAAAKRELAEAIGVRPDQIEITIKF
jgi:hypothetical protein